MHEATKTQTATERRLLLVEDSDSIRAVLKTILTDNGLQVVEACDGIGGIARLQENDSIGLVLLDLNMPNMGGLEMLRVIRSNPSWRDLPVVIMTGEASDVLTAARELGATGVLQKPVRSEAVIKIAQRILFGR